MRGPAPLEVWASGRAEMAVYRDGCGYSSDLTAGTKAKNGLSFGGYLPFFAVWPPTLGY